MNKLQHPFAEPPRTPKEILIELAKAIGRYEANREISERAKSESDRPASNSPGKNIAKESK